MRNEENKDTTDDRDVLDELRARQARRHADAVRQYWLLINQLACETLRKRDCAKAIDELDALASKLNRTPEDVQMDLTRRRELRNLKPEQISVDRSALLREKSKSESEHRRLAAAVAKAIEQQRQGHNSENQVSSRGSALHARETAIRELRQQLVSAGAPEDILPTIK